ncbi:MAG: DUF2277 domain-containing protein [Spirochaetales bacterium]|jgi:hypothetical protein|nr:DUF2277 domain-containing protein [Spirochaetales bacterium]
MCRNIRPLFNYDPPATSDDARAAAIQYVRKISGYTKPSKLNQTAFDAAVEEITTASVRLLTALVTTAPVRNREREILRLRAARLARDGSYQQ